MQRHILVFLIREIKHQDANIFASCFIFNLSFLWFFLFRMVRPSTPLKIFALSFALLLTLVTVTAIYLKQLHLFPFALRKKRFFWLHNINCFFCHYRSLWSSTKVFIIVIYFFYCFDLFLFECYRSACHH